ncbi:MAG: hypothetical protein OXD36_09280 [Rhodobacter sp.]|nr:hypothetical protein [Rhodobacter sp.]
MTVEPSSRIDGGRSAIYVRVNDHYAIDRDGIEAREELMGLLKDGFEKSIQRSDSIIDYIMSL